MEPSSKEKTSDVEPEESDEDKEAIVLIREDECENREKHEEGRNHRKSDREESDVFIVIGNDVEADLPDRDEDYPQDKYIVDEDGDPGYSFPDTKLGRVRYYVGMVMEHLAFRLFTLFLILADTTIVIVDLATGQDEHYHDELEICSRVIITYFLLEIMLRIFYKSDSFFHHWADLLDMIVVILTFILDFALSSYGRIGVIGRSVRVIRILRSLYLMYSEYKHFKGATRRMVSQNKRRFKKEGFDLDLCYVTERVIAMSYPSTGMRAVYRNPIKKVGKFLDTKHPERYKVYDLCSELNYDKAIFHNRVTKVKVDDHNVPRLRDMLSFCKSVRHWLSAHEDNVIAVHCKGGKGRTGTMICTWLIHAELFEEAEQSLEYFGDRRTDRRRGNTFQGVETPSQSRYVEYYERVKWELNGKLPPIRKVKITSIKVFSIKGMPHKRFTGVGKGDGSDLSFQIWRDGKSVYECILGTQTNCTVKLSEEEDILDMTLQNCPVLQEDVKCRFLSSSNNIPRVYDSCAFYFWFYTSFIEDNRLCLTRDEIDNPHKKKAQKVFRETFRIVVQFEDVTS